MEIIVPLTRGMNMIIDGQDYDLTEYDWCAHELGKPYAMRRDHITREAIWLYRVILERMIGRPLTSDERADHIDGNRLNNRRSNLRVATQSQNNQNRGAPINNMSGYKGVHFNQGRWKAKIQIDGVSIYLGHFDDLISAARAYNEAAMRYHGEFARLNIIPE